MVIGVVQVGSLATVIFADNQYCQSVARKNDGPMELHNPDQYSFEFFGLGWTDEGLLFDQCSES